MIMETYQADILPFVTDNPFPSIIILLLALVAIYGLWVFFSSGLDPSIDDRRYRNLKIIGSTATGLILLINGIALYKSTNTEEKAAQAQAVKNEQDLFNKAIEHLGDKDNESVRLVGIYALYGLAKKNEDYRNDVGVVLRSHIQKTINTESCTNTEISSEVQSLLTLFTDKKKNKIFAGSKVNFENACLREANLNGADLSKVQLQEADLTEAQLQGADLRGTNLREAQLQGADLSKAKLQGADLSKAKLQGAYLELAQLQGADLWEAQLQGTDLSKAQLQGAYLSKAQLQGAVLMGANLRQAKLQGAHLDGAQLQGANLWKAQLQGVDLWKAQLQGVNLWKAQIQGQDVNLTEAQLQGVSSKEDDWSDDFEKQINGRINEVAEIGTVIFSGGMTEEQWQEIEKIMNLDVAYQGGRTEQDLQALLNDLKDNHINDSPVTGASKEDVNKYLKGTDTGSYQKADAKKWIAEYKKAMEWEDNQDDN